MPHKFISHEVTCQCQRCWDVFDVTLRDRRGELEIESTIVAGIDVADRAAPRLIHRPGHCDGECRVISGNRGSLFPRWPSYDPLTR